MVIRAFLCQKIVDRTRKSCEIYSEGPDARFAVKTTNQKVGGSNPPGRTDLISFPSPIKGKRRRFESAVCVSTHYKLQAEVFRLRFALLSDHERQGAAKSPRMINFQDRFAVYDRHLTFPFIPYLIISN